MKKQLKNESFYRGIAYRGKPFAARLLAVLLLSLFLVACGGGGSGGGNATTPPVQEPQPNIPQPESPQPDPALRVSAGSDAEALENSIVSLDGSGCAVSVGNIVGYLWEQVSNGAPSVVLEDALTMRPRVLLPQLDRDTDFVFRLTVHADGNRTGQAEVVITGRPAPGILLSPVKGHTAAFNAAAEFTVRLKSRPVSEVTFLLTSSDESQGVPEQTRIVFTPENWNEAQRVVVRGRNTQVTDGVQDYRIDLGTSQSGDSFYDGIRPEPVPMKGIFLTLAAPESLSALVAEREAIMVPLVSYTGNDQLSYALITSPEGMQIDLSTGIIRWTPDEADEGGQFDVGVSVNDGARFASTTFQLRVARPEPVRTEMEGGTLRVADAATSLNGMSISPAPGERRAMGLSDGTAEDLSALVIERLIEEDLPEVPDWIKPLSDVFVVKRPFAGSLRLRFPLGTLPEGVSPEQLDLYALTEVQGETGAFWSPLALEKSYEGSMEAPVIVVDLGGLEGLAFWGYADVSATPPRRTSSAAGALAEGVSRSFAASRNIQCEQQYFFGILPRDLYVCTAEENGEARVVIEGFGSEAKRWGGAGASKEDVAGWVLDSQAGFAAKNLGFDKAIRVRIHAMEQGILGYVTTGLGEKRRVLHITADNSRSASLIQGTVAHEYFHHAQGHAGTAEEGKTLAIDMGSRAWWLTEGTARWFEDELYDSLNSYVSKERDGERILETGLGAIPDSNDNRSRPYQRFSFFKLVQDSCTGFDAGLVGLFNVNSSTDASGLESLAEFLRTASCDFGDHFGENRKARLEAALAYYNYATQFERKISLLDANEPDASFSFDKPEHAFDRPFYGTVEEWLAQTEGRAHKLNGVRNIPAAGAFSFRVPAIVGILPEGMVAELVVEASQEVLVSLTGGEEAFVGTNFMGNHRHSWFSTATQSSYVYGVDGRIPELFVSLVNPSLEDTVPVTVYFKIRDDLHVETHITSHTTGERVDRRVVSITGMIPEEARPFTDRVRVTTNGLVSDTRLNADGTFQADVVLSLGNNIIKAQGFSAARPVTLEKILLLEGVESSSSDRNALLASRMVLVLRWDTQGTDLDIYSTDKLNRTIWYREKSKEPGSLDFDNTTGYGPEVLSYRAVDHEVYRNGTFDVDVHYYQGSPSTHYTLDLILNETEGANRRVMKFASTLPHTRSSSSQNGPTGTGDSRFNDVLKVSCDARQVCSFSGYDVDRLVTVGESAAAPRTAASLTRVSMSAAPVERAEAAFSSAHEQCMAAYTRTLEKHGTVPWTCGEDGTKLW